MFSYFFKNFRIFYLSVLFLISVVFPSIIEHSYYSWNIHLLRFSVIWFSFHNNFLSPLPFHLWNKRVGKFSSWLIRNVIFLVELPESCTQLFKQVITNPCLRPQFREIVLRVLHVLYIFQFFFVLKVFFFFKISILVIATFISAISFTIFSSTSTYSSFSIHFRLCASLIFLLLWIKFVD